MNFEANELRDAGARSCLLYTSFGMSTSAMRTLATSSRHAFQPLRHHACRLMANSSIATARRVLSGWHQDPDFVDQEGKPLVLDFEGEGSTFQELCRRYSGDIGPRAVLDELRGIQAQAMTLAS